MRGEGGFDRLPLSRRWLALGELDARLSGEGAGRRGDRPFERLEVVAAFEEEPEAARLTTEVVQRRRHRAEGRGLQRQAREGVALVGIVAGGHEDQLGVERGQARQNDPAKRFSVGLAPGPGGEAHVDGRAASGSLARLSRRSGARVEGVLVERDEEDRVVRLEDLLGPVPVMDVPIDDRDVREPGSTRGRGRDRDVVDEAEAHRGSGPRVVAGWTEQGDRAFAGIPHQGIGEIGRRPGGEPGRLPRLGTEVGVRIEVPRALSQRAPKGPGVAGPVDTFDRLVTRFP